MYICVWRLLYYCHLAGDVGESRSIHTTHVQRAHNVTYALTMLCSAVHTAFAHYINISS